MSPLETKIVGYGGGSVLIGLFLWQSYGRYMDTIRDAKVNHFPWWKSHLLAIIFVLNIWGLIFGFFYCVWLMIHKTGWWGLLIYAVWFCVGMWIYSLILDSMPIKAEDDNHSRHERHHKQ